MTVTNAQLEAFHNIGGKMKDGAYTPGPSPMKKLSLLVRPAFIAAPGKTLVWGDFSNIEARVLPWLANSRGAEAKLDIFRATDSDPVNNPDVYCRTAADLVEMDAAQFWAIFKDETHELFDWAKDTRQSHGKVPELSLGFGGGLGALQAMARNYGVYLSDKVALEVIAKWRSANGWALTFWGKSNRNESYGIWGAICEAIANPDTIHEAGRVAYAFDSTYLGGTLFCALPCGRLLTYPQCKWEWREVEDKKTKKVEEKFQLTYRKGYGRSAMWYGKACLGADTLVLTRVGWKALFDVTPWDLVWDGIEWVAQEGLSFKGVRHTIPLDGVAMTPDHKVLCDGGWQQAKDCDGLDRASFRVPYGFTARPAAASRQAGDLGVSLRLREREDLLFGGLVTEEQADIAYFLRMPTTRHDKGESSDARNVETPGLRGMAFYAGPVPAIFTPGIQKLWWPGRVRVRAVAALRKLLGGYGRFVPARSDAGARGQQRELRARKLHVGDAPRAVVEHTSQPAYEHGRGGEAYGDTSFNGALPLDERPVYDLVNAGPRRRFMVMGRSGPFIVHNCENVTQGFAASLLRDYLKRVEFGRGAFIDLRPDDMELVMHTHDEGVAEVDERLAMDAAIYTKKEMEWVPPYAEGLPLAAEISTSWYYTKLAKGMHI